MTNTLVPSFLFLSIMMISSMNINAYTIKPGGDSSIGENVNAYKDAVAKSIKQSSIVNPMVIPPPTFFEEEEEEEDVMIVEDEGPPCYWFHQKIHTFGNTGLFGALHAACAPIATALIDALAYNGKNIRDEIAADLCTKVVSSSSSCKKTTKKVIDLCCGVGISTRSLQRAFASCDDDDVQVDIIGVDTSPEMIAMANLLSNKGYTTEATTCSASSQRTSSKQNKDKTGLQYSMVNAERTNQPSNSFDLVTIMYGFHEIPYLARQRILQESKRLLREGGTLSVIDICPNYKPSASMLAGEPYVLEYQTNIQKQLHLNKLGFEDVSYHEVVPGHVGWWQLTKAKVAAKTVSKKSNKKGLELNRPPFVEQWA